jgi:hypothetical protein
MGEARARHYKLDYDCKETGAFSQEGPSLAGLTAIAPRALPSENVLVGPTLQN